MADPISTVTTRARRSSSGDDVGDSRPRGLRGVLGQIAVIVGENLQADAAEGRGEALRPPGLGRALGALVVCATLTTVVIVANLGMGRAVGLSRRAMLAGVAAALVPRLSWAEGFDHEVVVLGAGLAGTTAALTLHDAGVPSLVLEASGRLGGRILSTTGEIAEGLVIERGGALIDSDHDEVIGLARRFGLPLFDRVADERAHPEIPVTAYQFGGVRLPEREMAKRLRPLARRLRRDARRLDRRFEVMSSELDGMSGRDYLDALEADHGPFEPGARALCEAVIRSDYGVEPAASSALELLYSLPRVRGRRVDAISEADEVYTVVGGNQRIVEAIATALPEGTIERHARVVRVEELVQGGFRVGVSDGRSFTARFVVVTLPFTVLRQIELVFREPQPRRLLDAVATYALGRNEKVILGVDGRIWQTPEGFRGELWSDRGLVWEASRAQPEHPVAALTVYLGGEQSAALATGVDPVAIARRFTPVVPGLDEALTGRVLATAWRSNPYSLGAYTTLPPGLVSRGPFVAWPEDPDEPALHVGCRGLVVAGEHVSEADYGYMNGAAETGRRAAEAILGAR